MLQVNKVSLSFGSKSLFDDVSFSVSSGQRIGLIGRNGAGKSTMLRIISKKQLPDSGSVSSPNEYTIGYLPQEVNFTSNLPLFEETYNSLTELKKLETNIESLNKEISERADYESDSYMKAISALTEATERFELLGGSKINEQIEKILRGLGFKRSEFEKPISEFSGGWQMRAELAKLLLQMPDCLLLDEPTNHLDIDSLIWIEGFLKEYPGVIIIVSHDRKFLDNITNRTIEVSGGKLYDQPLAYSDFVEFMEKQRELQKSAFENQQRKIAQTERFIERFRYKANLASRVQSRVKQLEKLELIEIDEGDTSTINFSFPAAPRCSRLVAEIKNLHKRYDDNHVIRGIDFAIERGERVAFVGKNGEGKSTLSRILAGYESYEGELKKGTNVELGFYSQNQADMLSSESTVFDVIDRAATGDIRKRIRTLLGAFLFIGDDIYKKVKVLSGGEKSRLALCKLLLQPVNFLLLDEPTNHLDMLSKDVLKQAIFDFEGALIIVSHDREFLQKLTDKTIEFYNGKIKEYPGSIDDYLYKKRITEIEDIQERTKLSEKKEQTNSSAKEDRERKKAVQRELNKAEKRISALEEEISSLELRITEYEEMFANPELAERPDEMSKLKSEFENTRKLLEDKMNEWSEASEQLEKLQVNFS